MSEPYSKFFQRLTRSSVMEMTAGVLLWVLPVLAFFQYRWLGQLSDSEAGRMRFNLKISSENLAREADRWWMDAMSVFQGPRRRGPAVSFLPSAWQEWQTLPHAGFLRSVRLVSSTTSEPMTISRFDPTRAQMVADTWEPSLRGVRERLAETVRPLPGGGGVEIHQEGWIGEFPWVVVPVWPSNLDATDGRPVVEHLVLELDTTMLAGEMFPRLLAANFAGFEDYAFILRDINSNAVRYASPGTDVTLASADHREPVGRVPLEDMIWTAPFLGASSGRGAYGGLGRGGRTFPSLEGRKDGVVGIEVNRRFETLWEISIRHRAGSLEKAAGASRLRHMLISFAAFVLLALSGFMLKRAARNARRLAQLQLEFVAGVTHELRTPLAVIRSAGENLADGVVSGPDQVRDYGRMVTKEGKRLSNMVEQVLAFAGMLTEKMVLKKEPMNLKEMIVESLEELEAGMSGTEFFITASISDDIPDILADRYAIRTIFRNLLDNALKYSRKDGSVEVLGTMDEENGQPFCRIAIQDNGLGISHDDLPHIFEPFYRGRQARQSQIHGNGLGLSLVKRAVEAHGGRITVESTPGQGSVFTVYLPTHSEELKKP